MSDQDILLICAPADWPNTIEGSSFAHRCHLCGKHVMVAPSGKRKLAETPAMKITCVPCARAILKKDGRGQTLEEEKKKYLETITPEESYELAHKIVPNLRRKRN